MKTTIEMQMNIVPMTMTFTTVLSNYRNTAWINDSQIVLIPIIDAHVVSKTPDLVDVAEGSEEAAEVNEGVIAGEATSVIKMKGKFTVEMAIEWKFTLCIISLKINGLI